MKSDQKGRIEQAHTLLHRVLPKETRFDFLTQWDVNLIVNHINSTPRVSLGGRTSHEVAFKTYGEDILKSFQLKWIDPDKVNLTPKLIRNNSVFGYLFLVTALRLCFRPWKQLLDKRKIF